MVTLIDHDRVLTKRDNRDRFISAMNKYIGDVMISRNGPYVFAEIDDDILRTNDFDLSLSQLLTRLFGVDQVQGK